MGEKFAITTALKGKIRLESYRNCRIARGDSLGAMIRKIASGDQRLFAQPRRYSYTWSAASDLSFTPKTRDETHPVHSSAQVRFNNFGVVHQIRAFAGEHDDAILHHIGALRYAEGLARVLFH